MEIWDDKQVCKEQKKQELKQEEEFVASFLIDTEPTACLQQLVTSTSDDVYVSDISIVNNEDDSPLFYDKCGQLLCVNSISLSDLRGLVQFVVFAQRGVVLSRSNPELAIIKYPDVNTFQFKTVLAKPNRFVIDESYNVSIEYNIFKTDDQISKHFDGSGSLVLDDKITLAPTMHQHMHAHLDAAIVEELLPDFTVSLQQTTFYNWFVQSNFIGSWSRKRGIQRAMCDPNFFDVADLLELYYIDSALLWRSRVGQYAIQRIFVPILLSLPTKANMSIFQTVINTSILRIYGKFHSTQACAFCQRSSPNAIRHLALFAQSHFCVVDSQCAMLLDLLFFVAATLHRFHFAATFDPTQSTHLEHVFIQSRQRLTDLGI